MVDRLDAAESRGADKAQSIALGERSWPALYRAQFESTKEELWEHLVEMCRWGWFEVRPAAALRSRSGYAQAPRLSVMDIAAVRTAAGRPQRAKSASERWREAVEANLQASEEGKRVASGYCIELVGHSPEDIVRQLNGLRELADSSILLREVSARLFWGMSKVLDDRQGLVAAVLGMDECPFPESPIQLQVHLPRTVMRGVLFIENAISFEKATRSSAAAIEGMALVFASGFKASARRLRTKDGASIFYARRGSVDEAQMTSFEEWLFETKPPLGLPVFFWGDLDWSGMRILKTLREVFEEVNAWEPGYAPMRAHLLEGHGHLPEAAEKRGQRPLEQTGCAYADAQLLPLLIQGFVDQEFFAG
jgi:hypothetical protein